MTKLAALEIGVENSTRREFLAQLRALGGLVLVASIPGVVKASDAQKYGADGMPHGWKDDPLAFVAIAPDGTVTIVVHRSEMGQGVRTGMPLIASGDGSHRQRPLRSLGTNASAPGHA